MLTFQHYLCDFEKIYLKKVFKLFINKISIQNTQKAFV